MSWWDHRKPISVPAADAAAADSFVDVVDDDGDPSVLVVVVVLPLLIILLMLQSHSEGSTHVACAGGGVGCRVIKTVDQVRSVGGSCLNQCHLVILPRHPVHVALLGAQATLRQQHD